MPRNVIEIIKDLRCRLRRAFAGWRLPSGHLSSEPALVIAPHPDDETFGCGNIIALKRKQGTRVGVIFLTDGEASMKGHLSIAPRVVAEIRKRESTEACAHLGLESDDLIRYSLQDGRVPRRGAAGFENAVGRLLGNIREFAPAEVYCPHPLDGHGDHTAAAEIAQEAVCHCISPPRLLFYTVWFWFTAPQGIRKHWDFMSAWKVDGRIVHPKKLKAINTYLNHLDPVCGIPYCGKLPLGLVYCARRSNEILFEQQLQIRR
jgi:LmbE family N-acetylglucosaminyl deacetylase